MSIKKVIDIIKKNKNFLISAHIGLEGDALGSCLALAYLLKKKKKNVIVVNEDQVPRQYRFLKDDRLIRPLDFLSGRKVSCSEKASKSKSMLPDVFFILDCADFSRCGKVAKFISKQIPVVSIDHHISNRRFADINWVEPKSSSVGEMIYKLYKAMKVGFDNKSALCIYTALLTDTGSFRFSTTNSFTHKAAAELLTFIKMPIDKIYQHVYECNSCSDILIFKKAIDSMEIDDSRKIAWFKVNKYLADLDGSRDQTENILDVARSIKGIKVAFILKKSKEKNMIRVNLRAKGQVDVSKIAYVFGGGGHKNASGCTVKGTFSSVEEKILREIRLFLKG